MQKYAATLRPKSGLPRVSSFGCEGLAPAAATGGKLSSPSNKRNATYLNEEEYDEDLAQLDMLLHYVNNLSASLEFLQWGNKRISTDLMPSLLSMYDAMYAKMSNGDDQTSSSGSASETTKSSSPSDESPTSLLLPADRSLLYNAESDSAKGDSISGSSFDSCGVRCVQCDQQQQSQSGDGMECPSDAGHKCPLRRRQPEDHRPLSSISTSSSCSSGSTPLGTAPSYMASVESLEGDGLPETARRRDRKVIKARREKLRTGSSDSGVQCHIISLPAPSTLRRRYCEPDLSYMDRIVLEIVETEEIYVRDLEEVIEGYLNYWKANPQPEIESVALESLFSNIEEIFTFNREFLCKLSLCGTDPVSVARCFVRHNRGFAIYTDYCTNYPRTVSVLTNIMRKEFSMRSCRERQMALGHTLPLGSYLLKPVQRVLKYHLLLGNIIKNFPKDQIGYDDIWDALSAMTGMAHHINDMKRRHEHAIRVQEIQSLLYGWSGEDLTTFGELAAEGTFRTHGHKGLRHVFLFDKMLLIAKKKDQNILVYKMHILCSNLMLIEAIPGEPLSFHVIPFENPKHQYTLECRSHEQKREWTQQLKRVILENYPADIPAHARQLVMELGQGKSNELNNIEPRISRRTHHAPEYLEKRKDRRRASEAGIKRNKSPPKNKAQSRSSSCTRTSIRKISVSSLSPFDKKQLRLPLWRGRSDHTGPPKDVLTKSESSGSLLKDKLFEASDIDNHSSIIDESSENIADPTANESRNVDKEENLHDIVTHLLQHRLEMQKKILNKQRRTLVSKKQTVSCPASDIEDDSRPPLPILPPPREIGRVPAGTDWPASEPYSIGSSVSSLASPEDEAAAGSRRKGSVGEGFTSECDVNSNYDTDVWNTLWAKFPAGEPLSVQGGDPLPQTPLGPADNDGILQNTVVSTECAIDAYNILHNYLGQTKRPDPTYKFPYPALHQDPNYPALQRDSNYPASYFYDSEDEAEGAGGCSANQIHPSHKIYKRLPLNKGNIRKILGRLASPRTPHHKSHGELSCDVSVRSADSSGAASTKTSVGGSGSIVSAVAKHYSKALREKVRQLTQDDAREEVARPPEGSGGSGQSIGARLAASHELSDYAVLLPCVKTGSCSRPDSVLSSLSFRTCSSSSSGLPPPLKPAAQPDGETVTTVGDSFYERSFDATEQELFRDSAIYSDPEDTDVSLSPLSSFRIKNSNRKWSPSKITQAISRQSSFRHSYNFGSERSTCSHVQRPILTEPVSAPQRTPTLHELSLAGDLQPTRLSTKLTRTSPLYNSVRVRPWANDRVRPCSNDNGGRKDFVLRNGWVKHIVDKLQDQND